MRRGAWSVFALLVCVIGGGTSHATAADARQTAFLQSLTRNIPARDRKEWDAYVAREGADQMAMSYYEFGKGICVAIQGGMSERDIIEGGQPFFTKERSAALLAAAKEVICPGAPLPASKKSD